MEVAETLRWETVEYTCAGEDTTEAVGLSSVGAVTGTAFVKSSGSSSDTWHTHAVNPKLEDDGSVTVFCDLLHDGSHYKYWLVTVGYER